MAEDFEAKFAQLKDPGIRAFLIEGAQLYPDDAVNFSMAEQRAFYDRYCSHFRKARPFGVAVQDFSVGDVACRRYTPRRNPTAGASALAGGKGSRRANLLYLHGGGFVVGGLDSHDDICAELASQAGVMVVAVQYRLAPEHRFPAAFDDCWAVLKALTHDGWPLVVAGDSAGGNLAAALCLKARDEGGPSIKGQVLIYPGLGGDVTKGSYVTQAHAPGLTTQDVLYYHETYGGGLNPYAAPLRASSHADLPPAFLVACGLDPLHDDCADYAAKLEAEGIAAEVRDEPLLVHAFLRARHMSRPAAESFAAIVAAVKRFAA